MTGLAGLGIAGVSVRVAMEMKPPAGGGLAGGFTEVLRNKI